MADNNCQGDSRLPLRPHTLPAPVDKSEIPLRGKTISALTLDEALTRIRRLEQQNLDLDAANKTLRTRVTGLDAANKTLRASSTAHAAALDEKDATIASLNADLASLRIEMNEGFELLARRGEDELRSARQGTEDAFKLITELVEENERLKENEGLKRIPVVTRILVVTSSRSRAEVMARVEAASEMAARKAEMYEVLEKEGWEMALRKCGAGADEMMGVEMGEEEGEEEDLEVKPVKKRKRNKHRNRKTHSSMPMAE
ncbi:hypothetical protein M011DRAFT_472186 [Sporormia fimetaria CBS 119925]|uniref:Uncharacterized protein n=1 Tax=Sporormia fimetaria CBS 119925 TaxID=1340428 RepID=A0A6A6UZS3_9PLEO|nr:hypothetical protein M011DRAFT_472186 [Sporormia fimetaria CBS 119925]